MGTANVIPGLSGGTLLLLTGIYPRFIDVFGSINPKSLRDYKWKENIVFIMIIAVGALLSIFAMSRIMSWLLESYDVPVYLLLIGLIIGSIDVITKKIDFKVNSSRITFVTGILMIVLLVIATRFFRTSTPAQGDVNLIILLTAGAIAAATMVLLLLGLYKPVVDSVSAFNIINVFFIGIGAIVGILFASRLIKYLLDKHSSSTYAFLLGLILASIVDLFPFSIFQTFNAFVIGIIALIFGIILGKGLKRLEKNYSEEKL
jgi:putative membrane protein